MCITLTQSICQLPLGLRFPMHQPNLARPFAHSGNEIDQATLVRMSRIAAQATDASANGVAFALEVDVTALRTVSLDRIARRSFGLVAHKQNIVARVAEHGLEVVDDASAGAHAVASNDDGGTCGTGQVLDHAQVIVMAVYRNQLLELQWTSTGLYPA